jgi:hypothetical protein
MIQKKICMVGGTGTGKTSLVRRYVDSIFSERYLSTVGVKIDRKTVSLFNVDIRLLLWDLEGRSKTEELRPSYLRGAAGVFYVADGTRAETFELVFDLRRQVTDAIGPVPSIVAINKCDLTGQWALGPDDLLRLETANLPGFQTSAKTGERVEEAFHWLAHETTKTKE